MIEETTTEKSRSESTVPWRWMLFGLALIAILTLLTFWAMDRDNVVWESGKPHCPHCRSDVHPYSRICTSCRQGFDWIPNDVPCDLCFTESDVARIHATRMRVAKDTTEDAEGWRARFLRWSEEIDAGDCVYCGGTGKDLFLPEGTDPRPCPVCLGEGECILCDGDEQVGVGDLRVHRDKVAHWRQLAILEGRLGSTPLEKKVAAYRDAVADLRGYVEIQDVNLPDGRNVVDVAVKVRGEFMAKFPPAPVE